MAAPAIGGGSLAYGVGVEAALHALARARGTSGTPFLEALAAVQLDSRFGAVHLDHNRQAIGPSYLSRVTARGMRTVRVVPEVEQTFGGYFTAAGQPPSETSPGCVRRAPPAWAR